MSHFTVLVIGYNQEDQLEKYDEGIEVEEYVSGQVTDEDKESFLNYYNNDFKLADPNLTSFDDAYTIGGGKWNSFQWRKDDNGKWQEYSTYNPESKWDCYVLGGRWTGFFKLKNGANADLGKKKDIDFEGMIKETLSYSLPLYDKIYEKNVGNEELFMSWADTLLCFPYDIDKARESYNNQKLVKIIREVTKDHFVDEERYVCTREEFIVNESHEAISTFAVVKDGKWYEKGNMGWWACVNNKNPNWKEEFKKLIDSAKDDDLFTLYDCHI